MISTGARLAALALTTTGALALAACEEHPYPSAAPREATAAPPPDDSTLAGAPTGAGYAPPTTRSPAYVPPGYPAPSGMAPMGPPPGAPYGPPPAGYAPGYGPRSPAAAPEIVTMAPIPNPPERPRDHARGYGWRHHHLHARAMPVYAPPAYGWQHRRHLHHHHRHLAYAPAVAPPVVHHHPAVAPMHPHAPAAKAGPVAPAASHVAKTQPAKPQLAQPQALDHHHHHRHATDAATVAAATGGPGNTTAAANTTDTASEADHYQALQQSLQDAFTSGAELSVPAHMEANQAADVTLTLPADFAQTVRTEAAKQNLSQQAATVNLIGSLAGDGYSIVPGEAQSQPLTLNTPTTFTWKVTPTGPGRGALKASVRAAVGEGHDLALGDKTTGSGAATGRVVGIGLLALIALVLLGWAAQRRRPKVTGASKPRSTHTNGGL